MTECRQNLWAQKTGASISAPKLCSLPPTTEAFEQNVLRANFQVAQWYSALSGNPPPLNATEYGWEQDQVIKTLVPRNLPDGVPYAPDQILKMIRCGCSSQTPCKGGNCGCMRHQLPCTMYCACGGGHICSTLSTKRRTLLRESVKMWTVIVVRTLKTMLMIRVSGVLLFISRCRQRPGV